MTGVVELLGICRPWRLPFRSLIILVDPDLELFGRRLENLTGKILPGAKTIPKTLGGLPVVQADARIVGIVSTIDMIKLLLTLV